MYVQFVHDDEGYDTVLARDEKLVNFWKIFFSECDIQSCDSLFISGTTVDCSRNPWNIQEGCGNILESFRRSISTFLIGSFSTRKDYVMSREVSRRICAFRNESH